MYTAVVADNMRQYDIWLKENIKPDKRQQFVYVNYAICSLRGLGIDGIIVITTKSITNECKILLKGRFTQDLIEVLYE